MKSIVWTIAGSDPGGGAGIQADLHTFQALGAFGCSVITAVTAQNSHEVNHVEIVSPENLRAQLMTLESDLSPKAIKLGYLGSVKSIKIISKFLEKTSCPIICDPVMVTSSGYCLLSDEAKQSLITNIFPKSNLVTPNRFEIETILGHAINYYDDIELAGKMLITQGVKAVLIKGGHFQDKESLDYFTNGKRSFWLRLPRYTHSNLHGSGCTLSSAIAACLSLGYELEDAIVIAKMYVTQGIRLATGYGRGPGPVAHSHWPETMIDLPKLSPSYQVNPNHFKPYQPNTIGLYPIVPRADWVMKLGILGIKTIQLRIKDLQGSQLINEIQKGIEYAKQYRVNLFINDYWKEAIEFGSCGVHLGQNDLEGADLEAIYKAGLYLGISTHCYYEVARAHYYHPSYIACGPIYETTSKKMKFKPQGLKQLARWRKTLDYPLVAIGGINKHNYSDVAVIGVDGISMISQIIQSRVYPDVIKELICEI